MSKITSSLRNTKDRIHANVSLKSYNFIFFIALIMIVVLAIVVRITPILRGDTLIKAFDPWIQWYTAEYLDTHSLYEFFTWHDYKSWYPGGMDRYLLRPGLPFTAVAIHKFLNLIGIPISLYDVCYYFPAFMGGISVLVMYFLGKEVLDKKCGLLAAFFMAFSVGYMSRTMAGFFDNETIGVFASLMTLLYFVKTLKTGKTTHALIGGIFLGYLSLSWGGYTYIFLILPIIVAVIILAKKYNEKVLIAYVGVQGMGLLIFSFFSVFQYEFLISELEIGAVFLFAILLIIFHFFYYKKKDYPNLYRNLINFLKWGVVPIILILAVIIWIAPDAIPLGLGPRFTSIISPLIREQMSIIASVAEHVPSPWSSFYYNTLVPLMLVPLGIYFSFKRGNAKDIVLMIALLTLFYFTGSMTRIILVFAPVASLVAAFGLSSILNTYGSFLGERKSGVSKKRRRQVKNTISNSEVFAVYLIVGVVCISQVAHAVNESVDRLSYGSIVTGTQFHDWEETLTWMNNNLDGSTVVVSWWDYGYWLTPIGNVTTVNDNATWNQTRIGMTGMAFMQTNEIYAAKILKELKADYILVYFTYLVTNLGGDEGKWQWMLRIANDNYELYKSYGLEEDNWADGAVFDESEYTTESGVKGDKWFDSQLAKLMFWGVSTNDQWTSQTNSLLGYYNNRIRSWKDQNDATWLSHIPTDGNYSSNVFIPVYFEGDNPYYGPSSQFGLVKLFKVDYTVLESSFSIEDAKVYDSGYSSFKLENTGTKDLTITKVTINGIEHDFSMGKGVHTNELKAGEEDLVWVDFDKDTFEEGNIAQIEVTAKAMGLESSYSFSEKTSNLLVKKGIEDSIKINEANSKVIQKDVDHVDIYLEIENDGLVTTYIKDIYADAESNPIEGYTTTYLSGSSILNPGETAYLKISDVDSDTVDFYPLYTQSHLIGVSTPNGYKDEVLFSSNYENYTLTVYNNSRIVSPEVSISLEGSYRYNIPVDLDNSHAYTYDNGTTEAFVRIKNTGELPVLINSVDCTTSNVWESISTSDYEWLSGSFYLEPNDESLMKITLEESLYFPIDVNDQLGIRITADGAATSSKVCSNVIYLHTINNTADIQIIETIDSLDVGVDGKDVSYMLANETGTLLVKNTGDQPITLDNVIVYDADMTSVNLDFQNANDIQFISGDDTLGLQECAYVTLNLTGLKINASNIVTVDVHTNISSIDIYGYTFEAVDNPPNGPTYYDIEIDEVNTDLNATHLEIYVLNQGSLDVNVNSIFINDTYISLSNFNYTTLEINPGVTLRLAIERNILINIFGSVSNYLSILVRTEEGPEDEVINLYVA